MVIYWGARAANTWCLKSFFYTHNKHGQALVGRQGTSSRLVDRMIGCTCC